MSRVARARDRLTQIADACPDAKIGRAIKRVVREDLHRVKHASSRKRAVHKRPTPVTVRRMRVFKAKHPDWNDGDIGRRYGIVNHREPSYIFYGNADGQPMFDRNGVPTGNAP